MSRAFPEGGYAPPNQFRRYRPGRDPESTHVTPHRGAVPETSETALSEAPGKKSARVQRARRKSCRTGARRRRGQTLGAEPAVAGAVGPQGPEKVDPAERGPVGVAEVELRVSALPQQEPAQALLPRGADHQVGIGLAGRVEVVRDVLHVQQLGQLLDRGSLGGVVVQQ